MSTMQALMTDRYSRLYFKILHQTHYPLIRFHSVNHTQPNTICLKCHNTTQQHNNMKQCKVLTDFSWPLLCGWLPSAAGFLRKYLLTQSNYISLHNIQLTFPIVASMFQTRDKCTRNFLSHSFNMCLKLKILTDTVQDNRQHVPTNLAEWAEVPKHFLCILTTCFIHKLPHHWQMHVGVPQDFMDNCTILDIDPTWLI